ncbi:MAG: hypothetical protein HY658_03930, partial [Actinobacteria bacterium]|nr:hypothetical protein [Actinomycetota bacterium]
MAPASGPNLVLVVLDTARADHVRAGPAFSALSRAGRSFRRSVAPAPWTLPS